MTKTYRQALEFYNPENSIIDYLGVIEPRVFAAAKMLSSCREILDVACYDGTYSKVFLSDSTEVYGLDIHPEIVKAACENGIKAKVANLEEKFPFESEYFDGIYAGEIIEHLYATDLFINELVRVLKPGGTLVISTPNVVSLPRRIFHLFGKAPFFEASNSFANNAKAVGHIRFFDKNLLKSFAETRGLIMKDFTSDYVNFPGKVKSKFLAKLIPTFGRSLIMSFEKPLN